MRLSIEILNIYLRWIADWWHLWEVLFALYHLLYLLTVLISHCLDIIIFFDVLSTHAGGNDNIQQKRSCIFNLGIFCLLATHQVYSLKSIALNFISISWMARVKIIHLIKKTILQKSKPDLIRILTIHSSETNVIQIIRHIKV